MHFLRILRLHTCHGVRVPHAAGLCCLEQCLALERMPAPSTLTRPRAQAGATAVVPETLEPGLQLASAVLSNLNMPPDDVQEAIQSFRRNHLMELQARPPPSFCLCHRRRSMRSHCMHCACLWCQQKPRLTWAWGAGAVQEQRLDAGLWLWQQPRGPGRRCGRL